MQYNQFLIMDITLSIKQSEVFKEVAQTTSYTVTKVIAVERPGASVFAKAAGKFGRFVLAGGNPAALWTVVKKPGLLTRLVGRILKAFGK